MLVGEIVVVEVVTGDVVDVVIIEVVTLTVLVVLVPPSSPEVVEVVTGCIDSGGGCACRGNGDLLIVLTGAVVLVDELLLIHWLVSSSQNKPLAQSASA